MRKVRKPSLPRGRIRFLDDDERERLLHACRASNNEYLYLVVVLAISTGMRKSEILNLSWQDVDISKQRITVHHTKNKERKIAPLSNLALDLMKSMYAELIQTCCFPAGWTSTNPLIFGHRGKRL